MTLLQDEDLAWREDPEGVELGTVKRHVSLRGRDVLEIGCGEGRFTAKYWGEPRSVVALDPEESTIRIAKSKVPPALSQRVRFRVGRAEELGFPNESFDVVIFSWSLCCVQDTRKSLQEAHRVLRQGGALVSIMPEAVTSCDMAMLKSFGGKDPIRQGTLDGSRALVQSVRDGLFLPFREDKISFDTYFSAVDDLIKWLPSVPGPFDQAEFEALSEKSLSEIRRFASNLKHDGSLRIRDGLVVSISSKR